MNINIQLLSNMREETELQRLNKVCKAQFEVDNKHDLYFYLNNAFKVSTVKWLCDKKVVKLNKPTGNFFVDWNYYHEVKNKATSSRKATSNKPKLQFNTSSLVC